MGDTPNSFDMVNRYGTYNIQPTADREDEYPAISQGLSRLENEERNRAREQWKSEQSHKAQSGGEKEAFPTRDYNEDAPPLPSDRNKSE